MQVEDIDSTPTIPTTDSPSPEARQQPSIINELVGIRQLADSGGRGRYKTSTALPEPHSPAHSPPNAADAIDEEAPMDITTSPPESFRMREPPARTPVLARGLSGQAALSVDIPGRSPALSRKASALASMYSPNPLAVQDINLPDSLNHVVYLVAKSSHDQWCQTQMAVGYEYAPGPVEGRLTSSLLVPWEHLRPHESQPRTSFALSFVRALLKLGFTVRMQAGHSAPASIRQAMPLRKGKPGLPEQSLAGAAKHALRAHAPARGHGSDLRWFKQGVLNACLFSVAR